MTHYETLGLQPDATPEEIKRAFRAKASAAHPDKGGTTEAMQAINRAHEVLSDPKRRARYDATGTDSAEPTLDDEAKQMLAQVFEGVISNSDGDWLQDAGSTLTQARNQTAHSRAQAEQRLAQLKARSGKIRSKGESNMVQAIIDRDIANLERQIEGAVRWLEVNARAAEMLADYEQDAPPVQPSFHWGAHPQDAMNAAGQAWARQAAEQNHVGSGWNSFWR